MNFPKSITIIRHGQTELNKEQRIRAWEDVPLDETGKKEASRMAEQLKGKLDCLIVSDLARALETAKVISDKADIPIAEVTKQLRPWNLGELTGELIEETLSTIFDFIRHPDKKVPQGESFNDFKNRFLKGLHRIFDQYAEQHIGLVTHHRNERLFEAWKKEGVNNDRIDPKQMEVRGISPGTFKMFNFPSEGTSKKKELVANKLK